MPEGFSIDVDESGFEQAVLEESRRRPVVVDFWAPWCGPCRTLGPLLERLAEEGGGRWRLAKVNVDENPGLASTWQVQGIPAVKAFRDGKMIDEFVGALPEPQIRAFLERFAPGPADDAVEEARAHLEAGRKEEARTAFERALEHKVRHGDALLALARLDLEAGETQAAERRLDLILPDDASRLESEIAQLRLALGGGGDLQEARERVAAAPEDLEARLALGRALAAAGQHEEALENLLAVVSASPRVGPGDEARKAMIEVFEAIGARSPMADAWREKLAAELYK